MHYYLFKFPPLLAWLRDVLVSDSLSFMVTLYALLFSNEYLELIVVGVLIKLDSVHWLVLRMLTIICVQHSVLCGQDKCIHLHSQIERINMKATINLFSAKALSFRELVWSGPWWELPIIVLLCIYSKKTLQYQIIYCLQKNWKVQQSTWEHTQVHK